MEVFGFIMCVLLTVGCVTSLCQGFKERVVDSNTRQIQFCISGGLAIWGWLIYF